MSELRECPCGRSVIGPHFMSEAYDNQWWEIACTCGRKLKSCSKKQVIKVWNHRPTEAKLRQRIAELEPKPSQTPFMDYLKQVRDETPTDSEQWDAINGAMHELDDRRAENERLQKRVGEVEDELLFFKRSVSKRAASFCNECEVHGHCPGVDWDCETLKEALTTTGEEGGENERG